MKQVKSTNLTWQVGRVGRTRREQLLGQKGATVWLTGLSGAGKSTLAVAAEAALVERGCLAYVLDGDNVRHDLNRNLGFSHQDRTENIRRVGEVAGLFADAGVICISAFISPYIADREMARKAAGDKFHEVYIKADVETCEQRDPKGLYKKARTGEIADFTGISAPYEAPIAAELVVPTDKLTPEEGLQLLTDYVTAKLNMPVL